MIECLVALRTQQDSDGRIGGKLTSDDLAYEARLSNAGRTDDEVGRGCGPQEFQSFLFRLIQVEIEPVLRKRIAGRAQLAPRVNEHRC